MAHIDLTQIPGWRELTHGQRSHAKELARRLQESGMVEDWRPGRTNQILFAREHILDKRSRYLERFRQDSLLSALTSPDKVVAFRALLLAEHYRGQLYALGYVVNSDAHNEAKARVEGFIPKRWR